MINPMKLLRLFFLFTIIILAAVTTAAQKKTITGVIKDSHSDEAVPFASVSFKNTTVGKLSDSSGSFSFSLTNWPSDTLEITCVGYQPFKYAINKAKDSILLNIAMERGTFNQSATVRT